MGILARERSSMEVDIVSVEEVLWDVRRLVRITWVFGISSYIDTSQGDFSSMRVPEVTLLDCKSQGRHDVSQATSRIPAS